MSWQVVIRPEVEPDIAEAAAWYEFDATMLTEKLHDNGRDLALTRDRWQVREAG